MSRVADPTARISLLRAAEEVFARKGLDAARVEEIARLAGLSKGAFYLHFEGKEEAFLHVVEAFLARCGSMIPRPSDELKLPESAEDLLAFGLEQDLQMYEFLWQNRAILAILHTCKGDYAYLFDAFRREMMGTIREWIEIFIARGIYRKDLDPELSAALMVGAHGELAHAMLASEKKPPLREWLQATRRLFLLGLAAHPRTLALGPPERVSLTVLPEAPPSEPRRRDPSRRPPRPGPDK